MAVELFTTGNAVNYELILAMGTLNVMERSGELSV